MSRQESGSNKTGGPAAARRAKKRKTSPKRKTPPSVLPPWKVLLHNDDVNTHDYVTRTIVELARLSEEDAVQRTREADRTGIALILVTHKERAELYRDQFQSKGLTVTIEAG